MVEAYEVRPREAARLCAIVNMDGRSALVASDRAWTRATVARRRPEHFDLSFA